MPKRTNEFQQLVYLIQHQLAKPPDVVVTESKFLPDLNTGRKAEVDIVVESKINDIPFVLSFECTGGKRKCPEPWVAGQIKKHEHRSNKLVLVSKAGFSAAALDLAARHMVEAITFGVAKEVAWPAFIDGYRSLLLANFAFTLQDYSIECVRLGPHQSTLDMSQPTTAVCSNGQRMPFVAVLGNFLQHDQRFGRQAMDEWNKHAADRRPKQLTITFKLSISEQQPLIIFQDESRPFSVVSVTGNVLAKVSSTPINLSPMQFMERRVAHGTVKMDGVGLTGKTIHLLMLEKRGEQPKGAVMLSANDGTSAHEVHEWVIGDGSTPDAR